MRNLGFWLLLVFLYMAFGRTTDYFLSDLHLPLIFSIACLFSVLAAGTLLTGLRSPIGRMLLGFTVWLVLAIPTSVWKGGSVELVGEQWSRSFAVFIITAGLISTLRQCAQTLTLLAYALLTITVLSFFFGGFRSGRFFLSQGFYSGPNELAEAMVLGCVCWWFMLHNPARARWKRVVSVACPPVMVYVLMLTGSRAGFVALCVVLVLVFLRYSVGGRLVLAMATVLGFVVSSLTLPNIISLRFLTFQSFNTEDLSAEETTHLDSALASSSQRIRLLKSSLDLTRRHPVFGVGPGQFMVAEAGDAVAAGRYGGMWRGTHNTYTQISSEAGIPALLFFLGCLYYCWKELRTADRYVRNHPSPERGEWIHVSATLHMALISTAVFFCFEHVAYHAFFPALAGIICAFSRGAREVAVPGVPAASVPTKPPAPWTAQRQLPSISR